MQTLVSDRLQQMLWLLWHQTLYDVLVQGCGCMHHSESFGGIARYLLGFTYSDLGAFSSVY